MQPGCFPANPAYRYMFAVQKLTEKDRQIRLKEHLEKLVYFRSFDLTFLDTAGLSTSRNSFIQSLTSKYVYFCDDDLRLNETALNRCVDYLEKHDEIGIVWGRSRTPDGRLRKSYPIDGTKISHFNAGRCGTPELLFRLSSIRSHKVYFDERFGAGAEFGRGEEYVFVTDLLKQGARGVHLAQTIFEHGWESTGSRADLVSRSAVIERVFGKWHPIAKAFYAARHTRLFRDVHSLRLFFTPTLLNREQ